MTTTDCPPLPVRITKSLLGYGVIAGPIYVLAVAAQMATRDGFDPTRHAASQLANGDLGWIQIATFLVTGAMTIAAAVGVRRALGTGSAVGVGLGSARGLRRRLSSSPGSSGPTRRTGSRRAPRPVWVRSVGMAWPISRSPASVSPAWSPRASCLAPGSPATGEGVLGVVLPHHRPGVRGQFPRVVVRIRRRDNDSGVHRGGRAGLGVAGGGVGQALPERWDRA